MKFLFVFILVIAAIAGTSQSKTENLVIITTDGFRWQEVFQGMDSAIANNSDYNQGDSDYIFKKYWDKDPKERRKKLLPFLWSVIGEKGQIYGNRKDGNKVDNANPFWFSYPGYSEIFTGYIDTSIKTNSHPANPNKTVLEFLHQQPKLKGRIAAFCAWYAFDRILHEQRSGFPVFSAFDSFGGSNPNANEKMINAIMKNSHRLWLEDECFDVFTHFGAMEYLKTKKPKVLYIAYGETDEWAHDEKYRSYLDAAKQVDAWIKEIWNFLQSDPQYKGKTTLLFTVDHGRGDQTKSEWTSHNNKIKGSHETWFAIMGPDTPEKGEVRESMQVYQQQFAQTIARLMGFMYKANHPVAEEISSVFKKKK